MKKIYRTVLLLTVFIFLSTYNPKNLNSISEKNHILFKIQKIEILNNFLVEKSEIEKKLNEIYNKSIFLVKRSDIEQPLKKIDFLEKIEVKKKYPNIIIIKVYETKPIAVLFRKDSKLLLDSSSNLIDLNKKMIIDNLPNIFGDGAENNFINFLNQLEKNNFPIKKVKNYYYFKIGRWDLELYNGQIIKFPPVKIKEAIQQSIELLNHKDFNNYNIIDLRIHGKIVVEQNDDS